ncbi:AAA family ATPase [Agrobacterium tumefaciens]|uniref:AAA family ATPase n=1 Tax=Agrobacterium tumefaciens TaxID=358 RepID=UPI001890E859|nr:AAA family ATPase [Agrobacterium tumefaciens]
MNHTDDTKGRKAPRYEFVLTNTMDLMRKQFPAVRWIVKDYVAEGFSVLAGRQKLGKTWLALDFAIAVATGGYAMGSIACAQGDVLYIDLENGERRINGRIATLFPSERNRPDLRHLNWVIDAAPLNKGFIDALESWRMAMPNPRLVVIDVLQRIKPAGIASRNAYENDYSIWAPLQQWATRNGIAVIGLHHTKKGGADDPLEALSGSNGLSAVADTTLVLDKDGNGVTLYVRGRDVQEKESALKFNGGMWDLVGEAAEVRRSEERSVILKALSDNPEPITPKDLAELMGLPHNNVKTLLHKMFQVGEVHKADGKGRYIHPKYAASLASAGTPSNHDNSVT